MNTNMIRILILKDLRFVARPLLCYLAAGLLALGVMSVESNTAFYAGSVLLITVLVSLGVHPSVTTVVGERKDQTLAFAMSLPISPADYTCSKLAGNLLFFFIPWSLLLLASAALIAVRPALPDGLMPFATIMYGAVAANAILILCVALQSESLDWTIGTMVVCNLALQGVMYAASHVPAIQRTLGGASADWNGPVFMFLAAEAGLALLLLGATVWLQSRKTDFI